MKKILLILGVLIAGTLIWQPAKAVCPVCTIALGAGVGLCRWLGIDDVISGIWIGGLAVSIILWILNFIAKKQISFPYSRFIISLLLYLIIIAPLYFLDIIGHPLNRIWGMDKLLFGIIIGSIVFLLSFWFHNFLKNKNQGKSFFPYQKVVLPVLSLIIISLIFNFLIKCPK